MLDENQHTKVTTNQNEEPPEQNVRGSIREITESTRLAGQKRFPYQVVDADGDLIEEVMMMVELEPTDLDQAMNDLNWLASM